MPSGRSPGSLNHCERNIGIDPVSEGLTPPPRPSTSWVGGGGGRLIRRDRMGQESGVGPPTWNMACCVGRDLV